MCNMLCFQFYLSFNDISLCVKVMIIKQIPRHLYWVRVSLQLQPVRVGWNFHQYLVV